jgi:hypothetical protein
MTKTSKTFVVLFFLGWTVFGLCAPAWSENSDDSLLVYAVNINRTSTQEWAGYGIYLGNGLIITAAHVVIHHWWASPRVLIAGQDLAGNVVKEGEFEKTDLTLLSVDADRLPVALRLRRNPLCKAPPWPGENVITVVPEGTARSQIISPQQLPANVRKFNTVIADAAGTRNSGSGVFDAERKCLLGIVSRKISEYQVLKSGKKTEPHDIAKYFVPASTIAEFIPPELRF